MQAPGSSTASSQFAEVMRVMSVTPKVITLAFSANPQYATATLILQMVSGLLPLGQIIVFKMFIDGVFKAISHVPHGPGTSTASISALFAAVGLQIILGFVLQLVSFICGAVRPVIQDELRRMLTLKIQTLILEKSNSFNGMYVFEDPAFYDMLHKAQSEVSWRPAVALDGLSTLAKDILGLTSMVLILVSFQPLLLLVILFCATPNLLVQFVQSYENWKLFDYDNPDMRRMDYYTNLLTTKEHAKEIRMFGLGKYFAGLFIQLGEAYRQRHLKMVLKQLSRTSFFSLVSISGSTGAWLYTVARALSGSISLGSMVLYGQALNSIDGYINSLIWSLAKLYEGDLYAGNLFAFLALQEPLSTAEATMTKVPPVSLQEGIEFRHVDFGYTNGQSVLKDLSFSIAPGQTIALVGENGAGKTTIVKLLSRLYDPTGGQILVDGVDIREFAIDRWRSSIAVVFQDYCQYHMTAGENIGIGQINLLNNLELIAKAAECGGATPIVDKLTSGYGTLLGRWLPGREEGAELSGGEWQRIALSRAFMRTGGNNGNGDGKTHDETMEQANLPAQAQAQILILDEPTSAFDVQSEHDVFERFAALTKGKTTLLISHRFSSVKMADIILVLKDGAIVEKGSHQALMADESGIYAQLYNMQAERYT